MQFSEKLALNFPAFWSARPKERTGLIYDNGKSANPRIIVIFYTALVTSNPFDGFCVFHIY
jgi:hypothetical protein